MTDPISSMNYMASRLLDGTGLHGFTHFDGYNYGCTGRYLFNHAAETLGAPVDSVDQAFLTWKRCVKCANKQATQLPLYRYDKENDICEADDGTLYCDPSSKEPLAEAADPAALGRFVKENGRNRHEYYFNQDYQVKLDVVNTNKSYVLGKLNKWKWTEEGDHYVITMLYNEGDVCSNGEPRTARVNLKCGPEKKLNSVSEPSTCSFVLDIDVQCCPSGPDYEQRSRAVCECDRALVTFLKDAEPMHSKYDGKKCVSGGGTGSSQCCQWNQFYYALFNTDKECCGSDGVREIGTC